MTKKSSFGWQWPKAFVQVGLRRPVDLGHLTPDRAVAMPEALAASQAARHAPMVTPAVLEIIAVRQ